MKEKSDDKDDLVHENLGNWQNILYCDPIKTLARSALRWKSCCFQSGAGNMEGEFEDGFEGIFLERRASIKDSYQRLRAEHPLLPTAYRRLKCFPLIFSYFFVKNFAFSKKFCKYFR